MSKRNNNFEEINVFKTDVQTLEQSKLILKLLPLFEAYFDLSDCDKILIVRGKNIQPEKIVEILNKNGWKCEHLV